MEHEFADIQRPEHCRREGQRFVQATLDAPDDNPFCVGASGPLQSGGQGGQSVILENVFCKFWS